MSSLGILYNTDITSTFPIQDTDRPFIIELGSPSIVKSVDDEREGTLGFIGSTAQPARSTAKPTINHFVSGGLYAGVTRIRGNRHSHCSTHTTDGRQPPSHPTESVPQRTYQAPQKRMRPPG